MKYQNVREGEIKNKVAQDYFWIYDCTKEIGNIDFCVGMHQSQKGLAEQESLLWAEAKKGSSDIYKSIVQLILTIGKARTFDKYLPPTFLGAFDAEKIAFIPYNDIQEIFYLNDFNWNVTPSNYDTKEFKLIHEKVKTVIDNQALLFNFLKDDQEIKKFIKNNFTVSKFGLTKTKIDKNNFISVFNKWLQIVKPTIIMNWEMAKQKSIIEADFYLADLISSENQTLKEKLFVILKKDIYELDKRLNDMGMFDIIYTKFKDNQVAHTQFWNRYERPPKEEYWDYIVERRDLLVPQDVRERKGSFFTPQIWVELSQKYLADVLGVDWQDEYYIWDCAAGTGNLLAGLTNKYHIWASTLDKQDVEVMKDRIQNGANLLQDNVFQFDFLNDEFAPKSKGGKMPDNLYNIISHPEKRKKLVIYINPPYAEAGSTKQRAGTGKNKRKLTVENKVYQRYKELISKASNELFAQFLIRISQEIPNCKIGNFSKIKILQSANFSQFREVFRFKLKKIFLVPSHTFDNVSGKFPIGFFVWDGMYSEEFQEIEADVFDTFGKKIGVKSVFSLNRFIPLSSFGKEEPNGNGNTEYIGHFAARGNDFQNQNAVFIDNITKQWKGGGVHILISSKNLHKVAISFAVRHCIEATWLNDRDQFLHPNDGWQKDIEFQNDCLAFTLFHSQNRISSKEGTNHWIPFTEQEVNARAMFESNFMSKYIKGKLKPNGNGTLLEPEKIRTTPLDFSPEATSVFNAGLELWKYYHRQENCDVNASLYDIRVYFQGRNEAGKMNNKSADETYHQFMADLRKALKLLAQKIEPKVYEYAFLKQ
ncbi:hypothetical protein [Thermoflexibacter ruber]|uniref:Uncharacterized protein n=1 Tax=Thermoflexibacter ruber TaxID=1003 RepID=A0A1I2IYL0_9BACT|nr:hypothetical protein [Thermoflexibacter ruber]SFF45571.1 hypothetical protein SAMN04488541_103623 [Thermoflexibacter ruber]